MKPLRSHTAVIRLKAIPRWIGGLYALLSLGLAPWILYVAITLPSHHRTANWDVVWTGFDIGLLITLLATAYTVLKRSLLHVMAATATGTLLLVDVWFDLINELGHSGFGQALSLALIIEIPLSLLSFYVAQRGLRHQPPLHTR